MKTFLPSPEGWFLLKPIIEAGKRTDFEADPVLAWGIEEYGGVIAIRAMTVAGPVANDDWLMRPDGSCTNGKTNHPDFAALVRAVNPDPWASGEDPGEVRLDAAGNPVQPVLVP